MLERAEFAPAAELAERLARQNPAAAHRAWLIAAEAHLRLGEFARAADAYRTYLAGCRDDRLRPFALARLMRCTSPDRAEPAAAPAEPPAGDLGAVGPDEHRVATAHFDVVSRNATLSALVAARAENDLRRIAFDLLAGAEPGCRVQIRIHPDLLSLPAGGAGGRFELTIGPDGVRRRTIRLVQRDPAGEFDPDMIDRVLPHELCHLVLTERFGDRPAPLWLQEGLATLAERHDPAERLWRVAAALLDGRAIPGPALRAMTDYPADQPGLFHDQSASFTEYLRGVLSPGQFAALLTELRAGWDFPIAIQRTLAWPGDELPERIDRAWERDALLQARLLDAAAAGVEAF